MPQGIDLNRPYICRQAGAGPQSMPIYMYKDDPGKYLKQNGLPVSDEQAIKANFDVQSDRRLGLMATRKAEALAEIEAEYAERSAEIEADVEADIAKEEEAAQEARDTGPTDLKTTHFGEVAKDGVRTTSQGEPRETATRKMEHLGAGVWKVIDKETGKTIKDGLDKVEAQLIVVQDA